MVVLNQVIIMALLILTGIICFKAKIITKESTQSLSSLVLMVINPIVIIVSYQEPFEKKLLNGILWSLLLSLISIIAAIIISSIMIRKKNDSAILERFSAIYSNCGFMGIPLVKGLYGSEGVLYITTFLAVFNIFVWTHGVYMMEGKVSREMAVKAVKTPAIVATVIGFLLFVLKIHIPDLMLTTLTYLDGMNTPLAMIAAGATIAQASIINSLKNLRLYYVSLIKLIIVPAAAMAMFCLLPIDNIVVGTVILASACPAAATGTLFAIRYNKNPLYASELFAVTTILSIATLPVIMSVTEKII